MQTIFFHFIINYIYVKLKTCVNNLHFGMDGRCVSVEKNGRHY